MLRRGSGIRDVYKRSTSVFEQPCSQPELQSSLPTVNSTKNRSSLGSNVSFAAAAAVAVATVAAVADDVAAIVAVLAALAVAVSAKTYVFSIVQFASW